MTESTAVDDSGLLGNAERVVTIPGLARNDQRISVLFARLARYMYLITLTEYTQTVNLLTMLAPYAATENATTQDLLWILDELLEHYVSPLPQQKP